MAIEQARSFLAQERLLIGLHFSGGADSRSDGEDTGTTEILILPAGAGSGGATDGRSLAWQTRRGRSGAQSAGRAERPPFGRSEFITPAQAVCRLQEALEQEVLQQGARAEAKTEAKAEAKTEAKAEAKTEAKANRKQARMVIASRTGGVLVEFVAGRVRRSSLNSHEASALLAQTGAMRQKPAAGRGVQQPGPARVGSLVPPATHQEQPVAATAGPLGAGSLLDPLEAGPLLQAIGIVGPGGAVRRDERRKYNQINHLLELLRGMLERLPRDRELVIVDAGCGKSQLLLLLNYVLTEKLGRRAHLIGLDAEPAAVRAAGALQQRMGYRNMEFIATAIRGWRAPAHIDLVISLHACDVATDEALALGVTSGAQGIVAVPCCQHELAPQLRSDQLEPLLSHPILRARLADWLTDGLRAVILESYGYTVDVLEYVSPLDTPKNILLRAELVAKGGAGAGGSGAARAAARGAEALALMELFGVRPSLPALIEATGRRAF